MSTDYEKMKSEEVEKVAQDLSHLVNSFDQQPMRELVTELAGEHRTLQQGYTRFALEWLFHLSQLPESHYDLRNEASVKIAKKIDQAVDLKYARMLPMI